MAVSYGFAQFAKRMYLRARGVGKQTELAVRRAAIAADRAAVLTTPVDTGRARGGWITTIGAPATIAPIAEDPGGDMAMAQARATIEQWKLGAAPIFITNNVVYIMALENGSSSQAPNGMTSAALQAAREELGKVRLLGKV